MPRRKRSVARVEHAFTHFHLELDVWKAAAIADGELRDDGVYRWVPLAELKSEALPSVMRKITAAMGVTPEPRPAVK